VPVRADLPDAFYVALVERIVRVRDSRQRLS